MASWGKAVWVYLKYILLEKTGLIEDIPPPSPYHGLIINVLEGILFSTVVVITTFLIANFKLDLFYRNTLKKILGNRKLKKDLFIEMYREVKPRLESVCELNEKMVKFVLEEEDSIARESFLCSKCEEREIEEIDYIKDIFLKLKTILQRRNENCSGTFIEFIKENSAGVLYPAEEYIPLNKNKTSENSMISDFNVIEEDDKETILWLLKIKKEFEGSFPELFERAEKEITNLNNIITPGLSEFYKKCYQKIKSEPSLDGIYADDSFSLKKFHQLENHYSELYYSNGSDTSNSSRSINTNVFNKTKYKPTPKDSKIISKTKRLTGFSKSFSTPPLRGKNSDTESIYRKYIFQDSNEYLRSKIKTEDLQEVDIGMETSSNSFERSFSSSLDRNNNILSINHPMVNEMLGLTNIPYQIHQFGEVKSLQKKFANQETVAGVKRDINTRQENSSCETGSQYQKNKNKTRSLPFDNSVIYDFPSQEHYPTRDENVEFESLYFMGENRHNKYNTPTLSFSKGKYGVPHNSERILSLEKSYGDQYHKKKSAHGLILRKKYHRRSEKNDDFANSNNEFDINKMSIKEKQSHVPAKTNDLESRSLSDSSLTEDERNSQSKPKRLGKDFREVKSSENMEQKIDLEKKKGETTIRSRIPVRIKSRKELVSTERPENKEVTIGSNEAFLNLSSIQKESSFKNVKKRNYSRGDKKTLSLLLEEEDDKGSLDDRSTPLEKRTGEEDKLIIRKKIGLLPKRGRRHGRFTPFPYKKDHNLYPIMEEDETEEIDK